VPIALTELTGRIVFDDYEDIFTMRPDGSDLRRVTTQPASEFDGDLSPDGRFVTYRDSPRGINEDGEIYIATIDGGEARNLTNDPANDWGPHWSPDGQWIAFNSDRGGGALAGYLVRPDGTDLTRLPIDVWFEYPSFSPDGTQVAFMGHAGGNHDIYVADVATGATTRLTDAPGSNGWPAWSPDGTTIAFTTERDDCLRAPAEQDCRQSGRGHAPAQRTRAGVDTRRDHVPARVNVPIARGVDRAGGGDGLTRTAARLLHGHRVMPGADLRLYRSSHRRQTVNGVRSRRTGLHRPIGWTSLLVAASLVAACGGEADEGAAVPSSAPGTGRAGAAVPLVVDTDLALDDLIALTFVLSSTAVDVRGITVSGTGEVRCPQGLAVVRSLLVVTGDEAIPVACGRSAPLAGNHAFPTEWRDAADDAWGADLPAATPPASERTAVELLTEVLNSGNVTLLTLGPLTNVADAFRSDPGLAGNVASVVVMGGAIDVAGNVDGQAIEPSRAEWNLYVDPTAAAEVLESGARVVLVSLDATNLVPITGEFLDVLGANRHTAAASLVATLLDENPLVHSGEAFFWDPFAAAVVVDPGVATTRPETISVVTDEGPDSGRTIRSDDGARVALVSGADTAAFEELLIRTLDQLSADAPLATAPPLVVDAVIRYNGSTCTYDGPTAVEPGRLRVTFETTTRGWTGAVAQLTGVVAVQDVVEALERTDSRTPGIGRVTVVVADAVTEVELARGTALVICGSEQPELLVADAVTVG
jgi:pyrimidine-specific ribonucleoside hydrolase